MRSTRPLRLESLESRCTPSTLTTTTDPSTLSTGSVYTSGTQIPLDSSSTTVVNLTSYPTSPTLTSSTSVTSGSTTGMTYTNGTYINLTPTPLPTAYSTVQPVDVIGTPLGY